MRVAGRPHGRDTETRFEAQMSEHSWLFTHGIFWVFLRFTRWHITPEGCVLFPGVRTATRAADFMPVNELFRVGSAEKTNQEGRDENRTRFAGSRVITVLSPELRYLKNF